MMRKHTSHNLPQEQTDVVDEAERLITRMIDSEDSAADRARFEQLAADDPMLWRRLAERQRDAVALAHGIERELAGAVNIDADCGPTRDETGAEAGTKSPMRRGVVAAATAVPGRPMQLQRTLLWAGWAAAVTLAVAWIIVGRAGDLTMPQPHSGTTARPAVGAEGRMSPEHLLREYLRSPAVVGELDPILLKHEQSPDGSSEMRIIRRIEEVYRFGAEDPLPTDKDGRLITGPAKLPR